jgi:hypothetical protein
VLVPVAVAVGGGHRLGQGHRVLVDQQSMRKTGSLAATTIRGGTTASLAGTNITNTKTDMADRRGHDEHG